MVAAAKQSSWEGGGYGRVQEGSGGFRRVQEGSAAELFRIIGGRRIAIVKSSEEYRFFRYCIKAVKVAKQGAVAKCGYASAGQLRDLAKLFLLCGEDGVQPDMNQLDMKAAYTPERADSSATWLSK
jgi:hypothetical protein